MSLSDWPGYQAVMLRKKCIKCDAPMTPVPEHVDFHQMCDACRDKRAAAEPTRENRLVIKWKGDTA